MTQKNNKFDVIVIGAGHAGCEAGLIAARMGMKTAMFCTDIESVAMMPCNPSIGGTGKGHLVREIDALGGEMGINIDKTFIQSKMLNTSKGPAVHSLRAQADKHRYHDEMLRVIRVQENLELIEDEVTELLTGNSHDSSFHDDKAVIEDSSVSLLSDDVNENAAAQYNDTDIKNNCTDGTGSCTFTESSDADKGETGKNAVLQTVNGVRTASGAVYSCRAAVICTGTFLGGKIFIGDDIRISGPGGLRPATKLGENLKELGFPIRRFKTGTPARMRRDTLNYDAMKEQKGDEKIVPFSFLNEDKEFDTEQISCWLSYTNEETHRIIRENITRSAMYSGNIVGVGPRYCPSIEDKVARFADRKRHQLFVEPEGLDTDLMYIQGMSSSLPEDVQHAFYATIQGLEHAEIVRPAYAIEYDCIDPLSLKPSLESKLMDGLFCAGQFNGSSGYEEAAAQGLIAGINAVRRLQGRDALVLRRDQAYIGVLIDDLVTKGTNEPYRIMTSRAEYRLLLRQDNADRRLTETGYRFGSVTEDRYRRFLAKKERVDTEIERLTQKRTDIDSFREFLRRHEINPLLETLDSLLSKSEEKLSTGLDSDNDSYSGAISVDCGNAMTASSDRTVGCAAADDEPSDRIADLTALIERKSSEIDETANQTFAELLRRPAVFYDDLAEIDDESRPDLSENEKTEVEVMLKYEGYIRKQINEVEKLQKLEGKKLPEEIDYNSIGGLRIEARQKLSNIRPLTVGQASRISGVSPADINVLLVWLEKEKLR